MMVEEDVADFEEIAKQSWQSFSTMKRFVSEANRLENASWRLWHMERLRRRQHPAQVSPTSLSSSSKSAKPTSKTANDFDDAESEAEPQPHVLCVYCEMHRASLSCHGCCHDAYCVSCFKLVHKKGHLATHTAVKIEALSPRERERLLAIHSEDAVHCPRDDRSDAASDHDSPVSPVSSSSCSSSSFLSPVALHSPQGMATIATAIATSTTATTTTTTKDKPVRSLQAKSWEIQMDMLLQRLMLNSLHSDNDISVHNIDSRRSLGNADSLASFLSDSTASEDPTEALARALDEMDSVQRGTPGTQCTQVTTEPAPGSESPVRAKTSTHQHQPLVVDVSATTKRQQQQQQKEEQEMMMKKESKVPPTAAMKPRSPMASPALHAVVSGLALESLDTLESLPSTPSSLFPSTLTKTKSRKKNSVCANCNGNHITIDCPLLETSLAAGGGSGSGSGIHSSSLHAGAHSIGGISSGGGGGGGGLCALGGVAGAGAGAGGSGSVDTVLRKCFTTIHNDNLSNSTHAFLGDEISVRGGGHFSKTQFSTSSFNGAFGMGTIAEDQTAAMDFDTEDALPVLASVLEPSDSREPRHWESTTWMVSSLATELPLDVYETLRVATKPHDPSSLRNGNNDEEDDDVAATLSGWIHLKRPGSKWRRRFVSLLRNNLWEYLDDKPSSRPIGYVNVADGSVHAHQNTRVEFAFRYFRFASPESPTDECWLQCESEREASQWRDALSAATKLQIEDLFDLRPDAKSSVAPCDAGYELGQGRFATVRRARRRHRRPAPCAHPEDEEDDCCALKIIDKRVFWDLVAHETERDDTVIREILTQTVLTVRAGPSDAYCPVIRLLSLFETRSLLVMELELMREGDLHEQIVTKSAVSESTAPFLVASLVQAIHFCQQNGVAHRDVKLSNLALDTTPPRSANTAPPTLSVLKLADFGMAAFVQSDGMLKGRCGTPGFVAPEILTAGKGEAYPSGVDMFSVGVVTYTMLCGYEPFFGVNDEELIQMNKAVEYEFEEPEWSSISDEAKDLISRMMEKDTRRRITPLAALQHPFLVDASRALAKVVSSTGSSHTRTRGPSLRIL